MKTIKNYSDDMQRTRTDDLVTTYKKMSEHPYHFDIRVTIVGTDVHPTTMGFKNVRFSFDRTAKTAEGRSYSDRIIGRFERMIGALQLEAKDQRVELRGLREELSISQSRVISDVTPANMNTGVVGVYMNISHAHDVRVFRTYRFDSIEALIVFLTAWHED